MISRTHPRGFTLIELLAVLAIIALLGTVSLAAINSALEHAQMSQSMSNLRQVTIANLSYAADNGVFVPADDWWNNRRWCGSRPASGQPYDPSKGLLADYLGKSKRVTPCPLFTRMIKNPKNLPTFEEGSGGYGYNDYIGGSYASNYTDDEQRLRISRPVLRVPHPSTTIMFATTALARSGGVQEYPYCHPPYWTDESGDPQPFYGRPTPSLHFRFNGRALVAWCDGHVTAEKCDPREVGYNPYGGDANAQQLGWFGPDEENGYWNPARTSALP